MALTLRNYCSSGHEIRNKKHSSSSTKVIVNSREARNANPEQDAENASSTQHPNCPLARTIINYTPMNMNISANISVIPET